MKRLIVVFFAAALMSPGSAYGGFSLFFLFGAAKGQPMTAAQKTKVCAAITHIAAVGTATGNPKWNKIAAGLTQMKNEGRICFDAHPYYAIGADGDGTLGSTRIRPGKKKDRINITPSGMAQDVAFLASILVHEYAHVCEPICILLVGGPKGNNRKAHCAVYFIEYCFNCDQLASGTLTPAQTVIITKEKGAIALTYGAFANWKKQGKIGMPGGGYKPLYARSSQASYSIGANPSQVSVSADSGGTVTVVTIDVGITVCSLRAYATSTGIEVLLVAGDVGGVGRVNAYWDSDADGFIDPSTETVIVTASDQLGIVSSITRTGTGADASYYIIDKDSSTIYEVEDSTGNQVPDTLGCEFASPTQFPEIEGGQSLHLAALANGLEGLAVSFSEDWLLRAAFHSDDNEAWVNLRDTDGNGTADWSSGLTIFADAIEYEPGFVDGVFKNKVQLIVDAPSGHTVEIRAWDSASGDFTEFLGAGSTGPDETATVSLSRGLHLHDIVRVCDTTSGIAGLEVEVSNPYPLVHEIAFPDGGTESGGNTVVIVGENLPANQPCKVFFGSNEAVVVSSSSDQLVVIAPAYALDSDPEAFDIVPVTIVPPGGQDQIDATHYLYTHD